MSDKIVYITPEERDAILAANKGLHHLIPGELDDGSLFIDADTLEELGPGGLFQHLAEPLTAHLSDVEIQPGTIEKSWSLDPMIYDFHAMTLKADADAAASDNPADSGGGIISGEAVKP